MTADPLAAARTLAPRIRAAADATERERHVPPALVAALAQAGLFRMAVPRALGGEEVEAASLLAAIEEVARADGSTGWVVMIGATTALLAAYLPDDAARAIYGDPLVVTGGVVAPRGRAIATRGGYRVTGRWPFASGCRHCAWLVGGCVVDHGGEPRVLFFPAADVEVVDTWTVSGLCGTASHDIAVTDLFVPAARSVALFADRPRHPGALYRFPLLGLLALGIAAVALGIARRAVDELIALAAGKTPTDGQRRLAERGAVQAEVATTEAELGAARALVAETVREAGDGGEIGLELRARLRLAATHATMRAAGAVDRMYTAGGGTSVYAASPLQRCFRDVHTATQHAMVAPATLELAGRVLLGLPIDASRL